MQPQVGSRISYFFAGAQQGDQPIPGRIIAFDSPTTIDAELFGPHGVHIVRNRQLVYAGQPAPTGDYCVFDPSMP